MEFTAVKDRIGAIERRAEALWHVKEDGQELRALIDRLKTDVDTASNVIADTQVCTACQALSRQPVHGATMWLPHFSWHGVGVLVLGRCIMVCGEQGKQDSEETVPTAGAQHHGHAQPQLPSTRLDMMHHSIP